MKANFIRTVAPYFEGVWHDLLDDMINSNAKLHLSLSQLADLGLRIEQLTEFVHKMPRNFREL